MTDLATTIDDVVTGVYRFPTDAPEADGTFTWNATTAVTVELHAGGEVGLGWTYSSPAAAGVIRHHFAEVVRGRNANDVDAGWEAMHRSARNIGTRGLAMQALSAIDIAWWDLKARLLDLPLTALLGAHRRSVPIYGSGGFTTFSDAQLAEQIDWWRSVGCAAMKIKIGESWGTEVARDLRRVEQLRDRCGDDVALMVDANGAYSVGQARRVGESLDELGVVWFEEPVSSDDTVGLALVRGLLRCDIAAGEYAADNYEMTHLLTAVDCLQLDVTRCGGYTGWLAGAALARAHQLDVSGHCAPSLHAPVAAAVPNLRHIEWFADHALLEPLLVQGVPPARHGRLELSGDRPGHGMRLHPEAERFAVA